MNNIFITSAIALTLLASPALAQDGSGSNFSGPYVGAYAGYDHVAISVEGAGDGSKDGVAFGAILGYNFDMGGAVVGLEAEVGDANTQEESTDLLVTGDHAIIAANRDFFLGARVGFKASPKTLIYAKGGYANTQVKVGYDDNAGTAFDESDDIHGLRIGGGVDYAIDNRLIVRAEYRYTEYSNYKYQGVDTGIGANRHQVLFGLIGRF